MSSPEKLRTKEQGAIIQTTTHTGSNHELSMLALEFESITKPLDKYLWSYSEAYLAEQRQELFFTTTFSIPFRVFTYTMTLWWLEPIVSGRRQ